MKNVMTILLALYSAVGFARVGAADGTTIHAAKQSAAHEVSADRVESTKIHDLTATMQVNDDETNIDELKRIGGAFATTYRISHTVNVSYEYPNKARFEGRAFGVGISLIYNGDLKAYHTPIKSSSMNVANQPGQKQSLLDLGIFAKDYLATDWKPTFLREENGLDVFQLSLRAVGNNSKEIVWVNPKTMITERRMSYNGDPKLIKELRYLKPMQIRPGIWVPTRIEIYNQFGKLGAVQDILNIKVNLGVDESLFDAS